MTINDEKTEMVFFIASWNWPKLSNMNNQSIEIIVNNVENNNGMMPKYGTLYRIDSENCNPEQVWYNMGYPTYPTKEQMETIQNASKLSPKNITTYNVTQSDFSFRFDILPYSVNVNQKLLLHTKTLPQATN